MLKRFVFLFLLSLNITLLINADTQLPKGVVEVKLFAHGNYDDSNSVTYPIKRQPSVGIRAYVGNGVLCVQEFEEQFTFRLIDVNSSIEVFSSTVLPGQNIISLPQNLCGDFFVDFDFSFISYRGVIYL